jgi:hypothetical protein
VVAVVAVLQGPDGGRRDGVGAGEERGRGERGVAEAVGEDADGAAEDADGAAEEGIGEPGGEQVRDPYGTEPRVQSRTDRRSQPRGLPLGEHEPRIDPAQPGEHVDGTGIGSGEGGGRRCTPRPRR